MNRRNLTAGPIVADRSAENLGEQLQTRRHTRTRRSVPDAEISSRGDQAE